ncbi:MAG: hypothetical protein IT239_01750 [Bacteroidia bacterium]|nr:hypothetical protein [Bacteroidia bacterium]
MNSKKITIWSLVGLLGAGVLSSCVKDKYDFSKVSVRNWSPNVAAPLVNANLTIRDILVNADKQGAIQVGSDGFCTLVYRGKLFSKQAKDFIQIPDQSFSSFNYNFSNTTTASGFNSAANGTSFGPYVQNMSYTLSSSYQIDSIFLKPGTKLSFNYANSLPADINITVTSASLKDKTTGVAFSKTFTVAQSSNSVQQYDLGGYVLNLNDGMGNRNVFGFTFSATLTKQGNASGSESISISPSFNNVNFSAIIGYVGTLANSIAPYQDTVGISIFTNSDALGGGTFTVVDPSVTAKITNYLGCNVKFSFDKLDAYTPNASHVNTNLNTLAGTPATQNVAINGAVNFATAGLTNVSITKNNTPSVVPFVNSQPKNVIYKVNAVINPGATGYIRNFFADTSRFEVDFDINMPLWGTAKNFSLRDTQDVDMKGLEQLNSINVRTYFDNQFPAEMLMSLVYVDSLYRPIITLVPSGSVVISAATVDPATGKLLTATSTQKDYTLTREHILKLKDAKKLLITATANTTNSGAVNVKFYDFYKLNVRLGIQVQPLVNVSSGK